VIAQFGIGQTAQILPVEADEPHIQLARSINRSLRDLVKGKWLESSWLETSRWLENRWLENRWLNR